MMRNVYDVSPIIHLDQVSYSLPILKSSSYMYYVVRIVFTAMGEKC